MAGRRDLIADMALRLVAAEGLRALTHRRVDTALGLPEGSTSYYARTRRDLVLLVVEAITTRVEGRLEPTGTLAAITPAHAADLVVGVLDRLLEDPDVQRARFAIMLEYEGDASVRDALLLTPQFLRASITHTTRIFVGLGIADPEAHTIEVLELLDALLLHRVVNDGRDSARAIMTHYYAGLVASPETRSPDSVSG